MQAKVQAPVEQSKQQIQTAQQPTQLLVEPQAAFQDSRAETAQLKAMQSMMGASSQIQKIQNLQALMATSALTQRRVVPGAEPLQRIQEEEPLQAISEAPLQREQAEAPAADPTPSDNSTPEAPSTETTKPNNTGLPNQLKAGIENLSGISMDHVKVHYNSDKPAQLQAHAYAQGSEIHVAPGQEQHLPHEAWHVVQQAQGRVRPTVQMKGDVQVNDDAGLEYEADLMGGRALGVRQFMTHDINIIETTPNTNGTIQRAVITTEPDLVFDRNVALAWKGGGAYADTPAIINGKIIPPSSNKEGMILAPQLTEIGGEWRMMPVDQHVGCRVEAPEAGPWTHPSHVKLEELDAFASAGGAPVAARTSLESSHTYTLIVHGEPSDAHLHTAILDHEMHHVAEQKEVINDVLVPWDAAVTNQTVSAADPLSAGLAYDQLGIEKAQDIANSIVDQMRSKGLAFHNTDHGKEPDISKVELDEPAGIYHVYLKPHL